MVRSLVRLIVVQAFLGLALTLPRFIAGLVEVKLVPFQIVFLTDDALPEPSSSNGSLNDMDVLSETRDHLVNTEFRKHLGFSSLTLIQTVRTGVEMMFTNGTKIAFGGSAYYSASVSTLPKILYLCFLGTNEVAYVDKLRLLGWSNLERALIMTMSGDMVDLVNGTSVTLGAANASSSPAQEQMGGNMSKAIIFISVLVPLAVVCLLGGCLVCYRARDGINWKKSLDANDPAWQANDANTNKLRRFTLEIQDVSDDNNSDMTPDMASVKAAVASGSRRGQQRHQSPRRITLNTYVSSRNTRAEDI